MKQQTHLTKTAKNEGELILKSILEICQIYHTPMFATIVIKNGDGKTDYDNIVYSAQSHQCRLYHDRIRKHLLIANGFESIPKIQPSDMVSVPVKAEENNKRYTVYALDEEQEQELQKRMTRLSVFSEKYNTSVFAEVAVRNKDGQTDYRTFWRRPDCQSYLYRDEIKRHLSISEQGFEAVLPRDTTFIDMEEVFGEYVE